MAARQEHTGNHGAPAQRRLRGVTDPSGWVGRYPALLLGRRREGGGWAGRVLIVVPDEHDEHRPDLAQHVDAAGAVVSGLGLPTTL